MKRASRTLGRYPDFHHGRVEFVRLAPANVDCLGTEGEFARVRCYIEQSMAPASTEIFLLAGKGTLA